MLADVANQHCVDHPCSDHRGNNVLGVSQGDLFECKIQSAIGGARCHFVTEPSYPKQAAVDYRDEFAGVSGERSKIVSPVVVSTSMSKQ